MEKWIDHPNVTAVLWAGLPGQESGNSLVDVLYGAYNPSGRLPYTIARNRSDYPAEIDYVSTGNEPPQPQVNYTEGLFIDYRHFDKKNITPRFEFGFGLSYTSFNYSNLVIEYIGDWNWKRHGAGAGAKYQDAHQAEGKGNRTKVGRFLAPALQRPRWRISADIENVGQAYGCDVPQLYLEYPSSAGEPPRVLRDFERVTLNPGEKGRVEWTLSRYDVSVWDVVGQDWVVPAGEFGIGIGKSSRLVEVKRGFEPGRDLEAWKE
jgi:beta-glucosidase